MNKRIKQLEEKIAENFRGLELIASTCENEARSRTEDETGKWTSLKGENETLKSELDDLKDLEKERVARAKALPNIPPIADHGASKSEEREVEKIQSKYSFKDAFRSLATGKEPTGLVKEMHEEAVEERRQYNGIVNGIGIPYKMLESRATVDQTNSAIQPTVVGGYVDAIRENALYSKVGVSEMNGLTADFKIPIVGKQSLAWATAENSAAADGGAQFTSTTLNPTRLTGYVDISNRILLQNGESALAAVMRDLGRETAQKIDAAMFNTSSVANAPTSIPATSGVGTFTEAAAYSANVSVHSDLVKAEQTLADAQGLSGSLAYICATNLLSDLKKSAQVASVIPAMSNQNYGFAIINGYPTYFSIAATKSAGVSGDLLFGDFASIKLGFFGGLDMVKDPISGLLTDETRVVVHRHLDFAAPQGGRFVKGTSLVA